MLEKHLIQKSGIKEITSENDFHTEIPAKIYYDANDAISDFDAESQNDCETIVDKTLATYLKNAQLLMKHQEHTLALHLLRQASNRDSKNSITLKMLAHCLDNLGRVVESVIAYKAYTKVDYCFESLFGYATALYKLNRDQEALDKYYEALAVLTEENGNLFELYKNMGNIFVRKGDFDGAEEYYNKAYTVNPQSDVLLVNFGTLEVQRNDFDKSLYCFRKAVELNPDNDKAWIGLAMVHNQFADIDLAWANIETAIEINSRNRTAVHLAANWALRDGKVQKAIEALEVYLSCVEEDEDMSLALIHLFCTAGQIDNALLEIERVLLWNPRHQEVRDLQKKILKSKKVS